MTANLLVHTGPCNGYMCHCHAFVAICTCNIWTYCGCGHTGQTHPTVVRDSPTPEPLAQRDGGRRPTPTATRQLGSLGRPNILEES